MTTNKAAIRRQYGKPSVITVESIEKPYPASDEVLIRVHATTVNRTDCGVLTANPGIMRLFTGLFKPNKIILGTDFAGEVEAVGTNVEGFKIGDRVFGFDDNGAASQTHYMTFPTSKSIAHIPEGINYAQAAASLEAAHYAFHFLNKLKLSAGHKVLLNGATGGIGSALLQFLKYKGVYVTAVCNTQNVELIKSLGADKIYDYKFEDFTKDKEQYDFVLDAVGKSRFKQCKPLLKDGGAYLSSELGPRCENIFLALITPFWGNKKVIFPLPLDIKASIRFIIHLLEKGKFRPVIDRVYQLEDAKAAYEYVISGQKTGNVILQMNVAI